MVLLVKKVSEYPFRFVCIASSPLTPVIMCKKNLNKIQKCVLVVVVFYFKVVNLTISSSQSNYFNVEQLPEITNFPGIFDFELSCEHFIGHKSTTTSESTFSTMLRKLFVKPNVNYPFNLKTTFNPPLNSFIKVLAVCKGNHVSSEPVLRCLKDSLDDRDSKHHFDFKYIQLHCYKLSFKSIRHWMEAIIESMTV